MKNNTFYILISLLISFSTLAKAEEIPVLNGEFTLTRMTAEQWQASWCIETQVSKLVFGPAVGTYRATHWSVANKDFKLADYNGEEAIERVDGQPFKCVSVNVTPYEEILETEYVSFSRFSNGGMSVFSGHFQPWALVENTPSYVKAKDTFIPMNGEIIIVPSTSIDTRRYVYYGPDNKQSSTHSVRVIDNNLPVWLTDLINETISSAEINLNEFLGDELKEPSKIFVGAARISEMEGFSIKGGAINSQIQFTLQGQDILTNTDWVSKDFPRLMTHEIIHLFQGAKWGINGGYLPWLTEGGSDALAFDMLLKTGQWESDFYDLYKSTIIKRCVNGGSGISIARAHEVGRYDLSYTCGALVNWLAADLASKYKTGTTTIDIWAAMDKAEVISTEQFQHLYTKALKSFGLSDIDMNNLLTFMTIKHENLGVALEKFKEANGL